MPASARFDQPAVKLRKLVRVDVGGDARAGALLQRLAKPPPFVRRKSVEDSLRVADVVDDVGVARGLLKTAPIEWQPVG